LGFRAPLDISEYVRRVEQAYIPPPEVLHERQRQSEERWNNPLQHGFATEFSTDARLDVRQIWDVNGWYTAMGFSYPFLSITVARLRLAYLDQDGPNDERLTWILKALRNPRIRAAYDTLQFGEHYADDPLFQRWLAQQAAREASRQRRAGMDADFDSVMADWGFDLSDGAPGSEIDTTSATVDSDGSETPMAGGPDRPWPWGYYTWRSDSRDLETLSRWQDLLVAQFARVGDRRRISVGFMGRQPHRATVCEWQQKTILLLHEDVEPTQDLAELMVARCTTPDEARS
jgi:hypothetical protein